MTAEVSITDSLTFCLQTVWEFRERTKLNYFLKASDRRAALLNAIRTLHKENQLSPTRREICNKLNLSSGELLWRDIEALECGNYLTVFRGEGKKTKSRNMVPKNIYNVPVFSSKNTNLAKKEMKVDSRLFDAPPHYAIELIDHVEGVGCKGAVVFIYSPVMLNKGMATIVDCNGDAFSFRKTVIESPVKPVFNGLLGGIVVGVISPINE